MLRRIPHLKALSELARLERDPKTGKLSGYYVDTVRKLFDPLGIEVEFIETKWGTFPGALASDQLREYVGSLGPGAENDVIDNPEGGQTPLGALLNRIVHGGLTHVGQLMYVRGLIERRHWFSR